MFNLLTRELDAKRFCKIVLVISLTCFGLIAAVNFVVNPYAQYKPALFEPYVQTSRSQKVELFRAMSTAPAGLILGSSRVMKLEPDYLEQKTGVPFFNAGMNLGKPEDFLAFLRFYENQSGHWPEVVVLGLDVYSLSDLNPVDARLLANTWLVRHIADIVPFPDRMKRWTELISWKQSIHSVKSFVKQIKRQENTPPSEKFRDDGLKVYLEREQQLSDGTYDFQSALDYNKREYTQLLRQFDTISKRRLNTFHEIVKTCNDNNVRLFVFTTPMHPELHDYLVPRTHLEARRREIASHLQKLAKRKNFRFVNLSEVESFGGDAQLFVDGIHPLEPNTRRMINALLSNDPLVLSPCDPFVKSPCDHLVKSTSEPLLTSTGEKVAQHAVQ